MVNKSWSLIRLEKLKFCLDKLQLIRSCIFSLAFGANFDTNAKGSHSQVS